MSDIVKRTTYVERLLPLVEVQKRLGGCSRASLYNWSHDGALRMVKVGRRTFVRESDLLAFIAGLPRTEGDNTEGTNR